MEIETPSWFEPFKAMIKKIVEALFGKESSVTPDIPQSIESAILSKNSTINPKALKAALEWKDHAKIKNKDFITVVDQDKFNYEKRYHMINMKDFTSRSEICAHGAGSNTDSDGKPDRFSDIEGSGMSSLGAMVFAEAYVSSKKAKNYSKTLGVSTSFNLSRRIDGLQSVLNGHMRARGCVLHDGNYVTPARAASKTIGNSLGCVVLYLPVIKDIFNDIEGSLLFCWDESLEASK